MQSSSSKIITGWSAGNQYTMITPSSAIELVGVSVQRTAAGWKMRYAPGIDADTTM